MIWYLIGIPTNEDGTEIKGTDTIYAATADRHVAVKALEVFRTFQTANRSTYAPGSICTTMDRAFAKECEVRSAAKQSAEQREISEDSSLGKLLEFAPGNKNE